MIEPGRSQVYKIIKMPKKPQPVWSEAECTRKFWVHGYRLLPPIKDCMDAQANLSLPLTQCHFASFAGLWQYVKGLNFEIDLMTVSPDNPHM